MTELLAVGDRVRIEAPNDTHFHGMTGTITTLHPRSMQVALDQIEVGAGTYPRNVYTFSITEVKPVEPKRSA